MCPRTVIQTVLEYLFSFLHIFEAWIFGACLPILTSYINRFSFIETAALLQSYNLFLLLYAIRRYRVVFTPYSPYLLLPYLE